MKNTTAFFGPIIILVGAALVFEPAISWIARMTDLDGLQITGLCVAALWALGWTAVALVGISSPRKW